jgi:APA family basic amino acid/polyamine antiporter
MMSMSNASPESVQTSPSLRREVGIFGATMMGLGAIVGTGIFVSMGHAAGVAGSGVLVAIVIAAIVAGLNGLSSAQLAAAHPVSGGTYEYGYRWLHPSLGFTAGWMFLCAKSASAATAALGFAGYGLQLSGLQHPSLPVPVAVAVVGLVAGVSLVGIRWSSLFNSVVVSVTLSTLGIFVIVGVLTLMRTAPESPDVVDALAGRKLLPIEASYIGLLEACALMFVAYTGYGRIATLGEEIRHPQRNIPIAIIATLAISMLLYVAVAWVAISTVGAEGLRQATQAQGAPLEAVARQFIYPDTSYVIAVGAITAMVGVLLNLVLGLSRVVLAMGRRGDLPKWFAHVDSTGRTAPAAVIGVALLIGSLVAIGNVKTTWSFSAFTVLVYYAITNMAAIRMADHERRYPRAVAWLGWLSCLFLAFWVEPEVWLFGVAMIVLGLCWWRWRAGLRQ